MRKNYNVVRKRKPINLRVKKRLLQKKTIVKIKKATKTAGKKNNKKDKKTNYLAVIDEAEEAITLLF